MLKVPCEGPGATSILSFEKPQNSNFLVWFSSFFHLFYAVTFELMLLSWFFSASNIYQEACPFRKTGVRFIQMIFCCLMFQLQTVEASFTLYLLHILLIFIIPGVTMVVMPPPNSVSNREEDLMNNEPTLSGKSIIGLIYPPPDIRGKYYLFCYK